MIKELWLKAETMQKYLKEECRIMSILSEKETEYGDGYQAIVFVADTRGVKKLKCWVQVDDALIKELETILGSESVKVVQREDPLDAFRDYIDEMHGILGVDKDIRVELMKIQRLDRIANALEKLSSCVSDYRQFCTAADVTGSVETN